MTKLLTDDGVRAREAGETTEALAQRVYERLGAGEKDARLLDGPKHHEARWERARAALFELVQRAERAR